MTGPDSQSMSDLSPHEPPLPIPYALYCMDGGAWGLIQGGTARRLTPIKWQRLRSGAEVSVVDAMPHEQEEGVPAQDRWETKKDELYAAIVHLCREFGFTGETTYDHIHQVVESISPEPFAP